MSKTKSDAPKVEVVSDRPPQRSLEEILRNPPRLELRPAEKIVTLTDLASSKSMRRS